jgi:hypothetical protein
MKLIGGDNGKSDEIPTPNDFPRLDVRASRCSQWVEVYGRNRAWGTYRTLIHRLSGNQDGTLAISTLHKRCGNRRVREGRQNRLKRLGLAIGIKIGGLFACKINDRTPKP